MSKYTFEIREIYDKLEDEFDKLDINIDFLSILENAIENNYDKIENKLQKFDDKSKINILQDFNDIIDDAIYDYFENNHKIQNIISEAMNLVDDIINKIKDSAKSETEKKREGKIKLLNNEYADKDWKLLLMKKRNEITEEELDEKRKKLELEKKHKLSLL